MNIKSALMSKEKESGSSDQGGTRNPWDTTNVTPLTHADRTVIAPMSPRSRQSSNASRTAVQALCIVLAAAVSIYCLIQYNTVYPAAVAVAALKILAYIDSRRHQTKRLWQIQNGRSKDADRAVPLVNSTAGVPSVVKTSNQILWQKRIYFLLMFVFAVSGIAWNWYSLRTSGYYYYQVSLVAPLGAVMFLAFVIDPDLHVEPRGKGKELIVRVCLIVGLVIGLINLYLMRM